MAKYDIKLNQEDLVGLLTENAVMQQLVESVVNQVLEAQMSEHLSADPYEHNAERTGYRNGHRVRQLYTRIGPLNLRVPQTRDGSFSTDIFKRYQRSEQAFVLGIMEMYLQGVSTRKVKKVTEELCGVTFSKSTVSELCVGLDTRVNAFKERRLDDKWYPFLIVDALVVDVRRDHAVRSTGFLKVFGVNEDGYREVLGWYLADSENEISWSTIFKDLKKRGLKGLEMVVSDSHKGLVKALKHEFQGVKWQRCQVHFVRNMLGHAPRHLRKELAGVLKLLCQAEDRETARTLANDFMVRFEGRAKKMVDNFENGFEDMLTVLSLPEPYRKRLRTTNLAERVNEETRRRQRVIRIFPNEASAERLIGALLVDRHNEWISGIKYFDMKEYWESKESQDGSSKPSPQQNVVQLDQRDILEKKIYSNFRT